MSLPNGDTPAFPMPAGEVFDPTAQGGLSKREYIAAMAMQGLLSDEEGFAKFADERDLADLSVAVADALLAALEGSS